MCGGMTWAVDSTGRPNKGNHKWLQVVGKLYMLEFLQFKFCTKFLYAICSVFLRIRAGIS